MPPDNVNSLRNDLRGVLVDVDGTLYHQTPLRTVIAAHLLIACFIKPRCTWFDVQSIRTYRAVMEDLRLQTTNRNFTTGKQLQETAGRLGINADRIQPRLHFWMHDLALRFLRCFPRRNLLRYLNEWNRRGVRLGVFSDYPVDAKLRALSIEKLFPVRICATDAEVGAYKPHVAGFYQASRKMGIAPEFLAYVGDRKELDEAGAKAAGFGATITVASGSEHPSLRALDKHLRKRFSTPEDTPCKLCGSGRTYRFRRSTLNENTGHLAFRITDNSFGETGALRRCRNCGFVFCEDTRQMRVESAYRKMRDPEYQRTAKPRRAQMRSILQRIRTAAPHAKSLLDVGAATGLLISEAQNMGFSAEGIEPSAWCVRAARDIYGIELREGTLRECFQDIPRYDIVTMIDVLEHSITPREMILSASKRLNPDGLIAITTPDIDSIAARFSRELWWHHRPEHVSYFNSRSLHSLLKREGFHIVSDTPTAMRLPLQYVLRRLSHYLWIFPIGFTLQRVARRISGKRAITLRLFDSRLVLARKEHRDGE